MRHDQSTSNGVNQPVGIAASAFFHDFGGVAARALIPCRLAGAPELRFRICFELARLARGGRLEIAIATVVDVFPEASGIAARALISFRLAGAIPIDLRASLERGDLADRRILEFANVAAALI